MHSPQIETESQINLPPKQYKEMTRITARIEESVKHHRTPQLLQGLYDLVCLGDPEMIQQTNPVKKVLGQINGMELLEMDLMEQVLAELGRHEKRGDRKSIIRLTDVAQLLNSKDIPEVGSYLDQLRTKYSPHPKKRGVGRRSFFAGVAAGVAVGFGTQQVSRAITNAAASSVSFNRDEVLKPLQAEPEEVEEPATATEVPPSPTNTAIPATATPFPATPTNPPEASKTATKSPVPPTKVPTLTPKPTNTPLPSATPSPRPTVTSTSTSTETPTQTPNPEDQAKKEVADKNIVEFFLGDLIKIFKQERLERLNDDPAYRERVDKELINSNNINLLYLGIDNTRERGQEFNNQGWGRSDVMMLISFNSHTFKTMAISLPRDLFAPEMLEFIQFRNSGYRINAVTMTPLVIRGFDDNKLARKITESATGIPVDMVVKTNIDFMQGYPGKPGIFDAIFPEGLKIRVKERIVDNAYPTAGYGYKRLVFEPSGAEGEVMHGRRLTEYARSRHGDSDFGRAQRQRQILLESMKILLPQVFKSFGKGDSSYLDSINSALETQVKDANLLADINLLEILKSLKTGLFKLRSTPVGLAALGILATKSLERSVGFKTAPDAMFVSYGLRRDQQGTIVNVDPNERYYQPYVLKVGGSRTDSQPTKLGNHLNYWKPIRAKVKALLTG